MQAPPSLPSPGGDAGARAIGYSDLSAYNNAVAAYQSYQQQNSPMGLAQQAQQMQIQANQPAIATLQAQGTTLADQYQNLLNSVMASGSATYNTAVSGENAYLGQHGILSNAGVGNNQLSQAENTVNTSNATNQANIQTDAANTQTSLAEQIAALQAGNVGSALSFANNIYNTQAGVTNTNTQAATSLANQKLTVSEPYLSTAGQVYNPSTLKFQTGNGGGGVDMNLLASRVAEHKMKNSRKAASGISQFVST